MCIFIEKYQLQNIRVDYVVKKVLYCYVDSLQIFVAAGDSSQNGFHIVRIELSLCRQHLNEDWVGFGKLQDPPMAGEVAAARSSTQQPVFRQKTESTSRDERLYLAAIGHQMPLGSLRGGGGPERNE